jgi:phage FluMu protein Com
MRKAKIDLEAVRASLHTACTKCGYRIPSAELRRVSFYEVQCPACKAIFTPESQVPKPQSQ